jgi:hypothetical protein
MPIQFICPNGHPLSAPSKQSGKPGRCPKCDVAYVTPTGEADPTDTGAEACAVDKGLAGTFEFLCPNGHKIKAAEEVVGQKAKCPECGERFRVPDQFSGSGEESSAVAPDVDGVTPDAVKGEIPLVDVRDGWSVPASILQGEHGMAELVAWIWDQKEPGVSVEVYLRDGSVMQADRYGEALSSTRVGVFGARTESGQIELSVISWDAVVTARVICDAESVEGLLEQ